jgi:PIN domain nuclease of toxin-antitoxin system
LILLDTQVLVWAALNPKRLSRTAASAIRRASRSKGVAIASITLWEIAQQMSRGRVEIAGTIESSLWKLMEDVVVKEITPEIATVAALFPPDYPGDPADRLIGATARAEGMSLVTADERIQASPLVKTIW